MSPQAESGVRVNFQPGNAESSRKVSSLESTSKSTLTQYAESSLGKYTEAHRFTA